MEMKTNTLEKFINGLSEEELKLISIIGRYTITNREANRNNITYMIDIKIPSLAYKWEATIKELANKKLLSWEGDIANFTTLGEEVARKVYELDYLTKFFYNEFYKAAEESQAHSKFCEKVYGRNLCQHGMTDMKQLELLLELLRYSKSENILEIGCGNGYITEYLSDSLNVNITGVDISEKSIEAAKTRTVNKVSRLKFEAVNIYDISFPEETFDAIIAIDSLFFVNPFEDVVERLNKYLKPKGILYVFYIYPPEIEKLRFSEELDRLNIRYEMLDLSKENYEHWKLKEEVLRELKDDFEGEDNSFLYNNRMTECTYEMYNFKRYLYKCYRRN